MNNANKKKSTPVINIGSASMLVIFIILCLVTFAVLTLSSASSDYNYSKKIAQRTTDYYTASATGEEVLADLDAVMEQTSQETSAGSSAYLDALEKNLEDFTSAAFPIEHDFQVDQPTISFGIPMNDSQMLSVVLLVYTPDSKDFKTAYYQIKTWQSVPSGTWNGDDSVHLIDLNE